MDQTTIAIIATVLFAGMFVLPYPKLAMDERKRGFRSFVSFAAGISLAYVFIDLIPEFSGLGDELLNEEAIVLPYPEYFVYFAALLGFVLFYGLERLVRWTREDGPRESAAARPELAVGAKQESIEEAREQAEEAKEAEELIDYRIKIIGLGAYAGLILYLMTAGAREGSEEGLVAYVIAMLFHFVALKHSLRYEYPGPYMRAGRWVMAAFCVAGAALGFAFELPLSVEAALMGFLGGMLIMNTTVMELPSEKEGRFGMFFLGSAVYAAMLMLVL